MKRTKTSQKTILTNDPSMTAWGWAVLDMDGVVLVAGAIKTAPTDKKLRIRKGDDRIRRISEINHTLINIISDNNVGLLLSELPHGSQSASAAVMIGATAAIMQTIGDCLNIPVEWFSEGDSKMAVIGRRSAKKDEMVTKINVLYHPVAWKNTKWRDEGIADALAIHYIALQQSTALKMMMKQ